MADEMTNSQPKTKYTNKDFINDVASKFVDQLRDGTSPLLTQYDPGVNPTPVNPVTDRPFRGANDLQLRLTAAQEGYQDPRWVTFEQANKNGWKIRRGEKATKVQYWINSKNQDKLDRDGNPVIGSDGKPEKETVKLERPTVIQYGVFNAEQLEGIPELIKEEPSIYPVARAQTLVNGMKFAKVADDALSRPFYNREKDELHMPAMDSFKSKEAYYDALLAGAAIGTGHHSRLDREIGVPGSQEYVSEKLTTELATMMIAGEIGLPTNPDRVSAHVDDFIRCAENHPLELLRSAAAASQIRSYIFEQELSIEHGQSTQKEQTPEMTPAPRNPTTDITQEMEIPVGSTGIFEVRGCTFDPDNDAVNSVSLKNVQELDLAIFDAFGVYATLDDGTQAHMRDFDTHDDAQEFAAKAEQQYAVDMRDRAADALKDRPLEATQSRYNRDDPRARTYIDVPKWEKDDAKALGAKWDNPKLSWYIPGDVEKEPFAKWLNKEKTQEQPAAPREFKREYLRVPAEEKDAAKEAGAKWDVKNRGWYVMKDDAEAVARCEKWRSRDNKPERCSTEPALSPEEEFRAALVNMGAREESLQGHPIADGKFQRIEEQNDKNGEKSMSYKFYTDGRPAGFIQNNRTGEKNNWTAKGHTLTPEKKAEIQAEAGQKLEERSQQEEKSRQEAVSKLSERLEFFAGQAPDQFKTSYMEAKGIDHHAGVYRHHKEENTMIVPAYNALGELQSAQYVNPDGKKSFAVGTSKTGAFHVIGHGTSGALKDAPAIVISEGYATAATITESVGFPTVSAFDSGNLPHVAKALREQYPDKPIIMAADDDAHQKSNPGKNKAYAAAKQVGGWVDLPRFTDEQKATAEEAGKKLTDFNDLAAVHPEGKDAVKRQITNAMDKQKAHAARQQFQERSQEKTQEVGMSR